MIHKRTIRARPTAVTTSTRQVVSDHTGRHWTCYGPGGECHRFDGAVCVCGQHLEGHDPGDEDRGQP